MPGLHKEIKKAGVISQSGSIKKHLVVKKTITVKNGISQITLMPSDSFKIECTISFPSPIGKQKVIFNKPLTEVYEQILNARTFCFYDDIELMRKNGLAKGGSLENAVVIKGNKILNKEGLRTNNEFIYHKVLDLIGDLALSSYNIMGPIIAECPGHETNKLIMEKLFSDFSNFQIVQDNQTSSNRKIENNCIALGSV